MADRRPGPDARWPAIREDAAWATDVAPDVPPYHRVESVAVAQDRAAWLLAEHPATCTDREREQFLAVDGGSDRLGSGTAQGTPPDGPSVVTSWTPVVAPLLLFDGRVWAAGTRAGSFRIGGATVGVPARV